MRYLQRLRPGPQLRGFRAVTCRVSLGMGLTAGWVSPIVSTGKAQPPSAPSFNPATGLPMQRGGGVDVGGNPHGMNLHQGPSFNPATGLPMQRGGVDVAGNPLGMNLHRPPAFPPTH